jgi:sigma-54 specific flagellar transcriptional regulator A
MVQCSAIAEIPLTAVRLPTGRSAAIREVVHLLQQVAAHDSSVLILGESGTGKEVVARAIHDSSPRRRGPFVAVNCGAIPSELLESELFGHEKGSFTGAYTARKGRFEIAEGGTLFLDEIGDMSLPMQVKLLRVLQERVFERVGNHQPISCNVRIIAATHRNLEESILNGQFRGDLFYRLNVFPIEMPALRERLEDLPALIDDFVAQNAAAGRGRIEFSERALAALRTYAWPGNVRELANLIERLSIMHGGRCIRVQDLPPRYRPVGELESNRDAEAVATPAQAAAAPACLEVADDDETSPPPGECLREQQVLELLEPASNVVVASPLADLPAAGLDLKAHLAAIECGLIRQALERSGGTVAHAARLLGLRRTTLVEKLRKYGFGAELATEI